MTEEQLILRVLYLFGSPIQMCTLVHNTGIPCTTIYGILKSLIETNVVTVVTPRCSRGKYIKYTLVNMNSMFTYVTPIVFPIPTVNTVIKQFLFGDFNAEQTTSD